jgi:glycosyltransferase involved in cell wall biosynthesis
MMMNTHSPIKVLMLLDNVAVSDRRVMREAEAIAAEGYDITLVCVKGKDLAEKEEVNGVKILRWMEAEPLFDIKNKTYVKTLAQQLAKDFQPHILHTHDRVMLYLAAAFLQLQPKVKFIHDIHEMHFSFPVISTSSSWSIRIKSWMVHQIRVAREKQNMKLVDRFITVNDSLEENLRLHFHLPRQGVVLRNIPELIPTPTKTDVVREFFNIPSSTKILVFIGANVYKNVLNVEQVIDEIKNQEGLAFVFICANNSNRQLIEAYAKEVGAKNVYFHDLLPVSKIQTYLASCDVGLVPTWNKTNLSYWFALDNKLFEYMSSEIPILATAQPEYEKIVSNHQIGVCINPDEPNAYINGLRFILENYDSFKPNLVKAKAILNWEQEKLKLIQLYKEVSTEIANN